MVNKDLHEQLSIPAKIKYSMDGGDTKLTEAELAEHGLKPEGFRPEQDVTAGPLNEVEDGSFARAILRGLQTRTNGDMDASAVMAHRRHKPGRTHAADPFRPNVYEGTVDPVTIAERRAKNKIGRRQRVMNARRARR